ncbi:CapA family protein [Treponema primitia]|uniref:CapA family protein n=1 Tax=Treponema primitia TaxID=88058 RepID=UPI00025554E5|nr:CapA family protein [Treponema primitia]
MLITLGIIGRNFSEATPLEANFREAEFQTAYSFTQGLLEGANQLPSDLSLVQPDSIVRDLTLELYSQWQFEVENNDVSHSEAFTLSRTYLVPRDTAQNGRRDTTLEACLAGAETLVPLRELSPPMIALRVDGLSAGDEGYPLIWETRARFPADTEGQGGRDRKKEARVESLRIEIETLLRERLLAADPLLETRPRLFWLATAGDLMLGRGAGDILLREGPGGIFGETAGLFMAADLAIVNLEGAVSSRGSRVEKTYNFRFPPVMAGALQQAGIDAVLLANNHIYDFGPDAFLDTLSHLEAAGIGILGAGRNLEAAASPFVFTGDGTGLLPVHAFGIASYPREASGWDGLSITAGENKPGILHAGRGGADKLKERFSTEALDMVFFHGGSEWTTAPDARTRGIYTELIKAGADIIIGSHPHIVQGFEWIDGKPIFWSLGNFVFAGMENTGGGDEGLFLQLGFLGERLVYIEPLPLTLSGPRTKIAPMEELKTFYTRSR